MVHVEQDYQFGIKEQSKVLPLLKEFFGREIVEETNKWSKYDFSDDQALYELKTRKNKKRAYPTTLMTCNKVCTTDKELYFVFNFTDELCIIRYTQDLFNGFERKLFSRIDSKQDEKEYFFIPIEYLTTIKCF